MPIDEYTLRRQIVAAIPQTICHWLINYKDLSISTSTVVEWVDAVERRERELLERDAYDATVSTTKRTTLGSTRYYRSTTNSGSRTPRTSTTTANAETTGESNATKAQTDIGNKPKSFNKPRTSDRGTPSRQPVSERQRVPLADIVCHACGKKGHYKGSKECSKTPSSARMHAMGADADSEEQPHAEEDDASEANFDGEEYSEDDDFGPTEVETPLDDVGTGAVIATLHLDEVEDEDDDKVVYVANMATQKTSSTSDTTVATELLKSVKTNYEVRGSGTKPRHVGKTKGQLKADSNVDWASNSNVNRTHPGDGRTAPPRRQGLSTLVKVNGIEAYTCWDTGSELDAITPDFIRAVGITSTPKSEPLRIRLGTKGSTSRTSYEAKPMLDFGHSKSEHALDVVNLDRWDLLLGSPFCNRHGVVLDYESRTIRWGNTVLNALTREEEAAIRKGDKTARLHTIGK
jgi:hypothetical protein